MEKQSTPESPSADVSKGNPIRKPIVFMFQPTEFVPVLPDKIKEWQDGLRIAVGPNAEPIHELIKAGAYIETTSICRPGGADDCDAHEV